MIFRTSFLIGATAFWLVMMSQLIQKEFFQITTLQNPYEIVPITSTPIREDYRGVYLGEQRIGFDYRSLQKMAEDKAKEGVYELHHNSYLYFLLLGNKTEMLVQGRAWLDGRLYLQKFKIFVQSKEYGTHVQGQAVKDHLDVVIQENNREPTRKTIPIEGPILYSEVLDNIWTPSNLKVGKRGRFQVFNPLLLNVESMVFRVERKEKIQHDGKNIEVFAIDFKNGPLETKAWVNSEGLVLRKENPNGLTILSEPGWKIFDAIRNKQAAPPDLPNLYSIPSNKILRNPAKIKKLKIRLTAFRQENEVNLERENFDGLGSTLWADLQKEDFSEFLKPTEWIQSGDPEIKKQAAQIIGQEKSVLQAGLKLMRWVHKNMIPQPRAGMPSAREILIRKTGDCNEYTALFTALARSAGIPTKMIAGLVYQNGRFFYHAWAGIYAGRWVSLDPTFGQAPVDVTHLPLILGDIKDQINLASQLGQIRIFILKAD